MPVSELKTIKRFAEFRPRDAINNIPPNTRGIYALLKYRPRLKLYDVVYIGMSGGRKVGIKSRMWSHSQSKSKSGLWTHFSIFEVHDNVMEAEIKELEGLFRQIYRKDRRANKLNKQKQSKKLLRVRENHLDLWE